MLPQNKASAKADRVDCHPRHWSIVEAKADLLWSREGYVFIVLLLQSLTVTKEPKGEKASWCRHQQYPHHLFERHLAESK